MNLGWKRCYFLPAEGKQNTTIPSITQPGKVILVQSCISPLLRIAPAPQWKKLWMWSWWRDPATPEPHCTDHHYGNGSWGGGLADGRPSRVHRFVTSSKSLNRTCIVVAAADIGLRRSMSQNTHLKICILWPCTHRAWCNRNIISFISDEWRCHFQFTR